MSIINCPECKKEISDQSEICINCGYPIKKYLEELKAKELHKERVQQLKIEEEKRLEEINEKRAKEREKIQKELDLKIKDYEINPYYFLLLMILPLIFFVMFFLLMILDFKIIYLMANLVSGFLIIVFAASFIDGMKEYRAVCKMTESELYEYKKNKILKETKARGDIRFTILEEDNSKEIKLDSYSINHELYKLTFKRFETQYLYKKNRIEANVIVLKIYGNYRPQAEKINLNEEYVIFDGIKESNANQIKRCLERYGCIVEMELSNEPCLNPIDAQIEQYLATKDVLKCPRCGSTAITTGQRGYSLMTGLLGSNKTVNRCGSCGHSWTP